MICMTCTFHTSCPVEKLTKVKCFACNDFEM